MTASKTTKRKYWTSDQIRVLKKRARKKSVLELARDLHRTPGAVRQKAFSMGVSLDTRAAA